MHRPPQQMNTKFRLRTLVIITAVVALLVFGTVAIVQKLDGVNQAYWREAFVDGHVTREEAREAVGDIVDTWGEPLSK